MRRAGDTPLLPFYRVLLPIVPRQRSLVVCLSCKRGATGYQGDDDLDRLASVFVTRHWPLWKQADVLLWLYGACRVAARAHDLATLAGGDGDGDGDGEECGGVGGPGVDAECVDVPAAVLMARSAVDSDADALRCFGGSASCAATVALWLRQLRRALFGTSLGRSCGGGGGAPSVAAPCVVPQWLAGRDERWTSVGAVREALQHYNDVIASGMGRHLIVV